MYVSPNLVPVDHEHMVFPYQGYCLTKLLSLVGPDNRLWRLHCYNGVLRIRIFARTLRNKMLEACKNAFSRRCISFHFNNRRKGYMSSRRVSA